MMPRRASQEGFSVQAAFAKKAIFRSIGLEPILWLGGLAMLGIIGTSAETHPSICPLALAGLDFCPGCGLGSSIALLLHGEFARSFEAHWLGLPATVILVGRSLNLAVRNWKEHNTTEYHQH